MYDESGAFDIASFEKGLDDNDKNISPAMRYFYVANKLGCPYVNFAPSLTNVPALEEQANELGNPYAGMDGKTGQTLLKTALAAMFKVRNIKVQVGSGLGSIQESISPVFMGKIYDLFHRVDRAKRVRCIDH